MVRIYAARDVFEAQMIRDFLVEKGVGCQYYQNIVGLQAGVYEIPLFVADGDFSPELQAEIQAFLHMDHSAEEAEVPELAPEAEPSPSAIEKNDIAPSVWGPFQAFALFLCVALPGGFAALWMLLGIRRSYDGTLWNLAALAILSVFILKKRFGIREYLNLVAIRQRDFWYAVGATGILFAIEFYLFRALQLPTSPYFAKAMKFAPAYTAVSAILMAPLAEEAIFRGFLFKSFERTRPWIGILLTDVVWTLLHYTYSGHELAAVFVSGLLFGFARLKSGSLVTAITMHSCLNAFVVLAYFLNR